MSISLHQPNANLIYQLRGLPMGGAVLHLCSHPDDEDVGMVAYLARKLGVRVVCWSATRGEGGQTRIGPYQGESLGIYRTWESQAAREIDGGEALFGPFVDFGFSKNGAEALDKWGRERLVREIVRAIRFVQPQIVIGRWSGTEHDGHGHHQAVGLVTPEAFAAAGDPHKYPELREHGLVAWQPRKLYLSTMGDWQPGEEVEFGKIIPAFERAGVVRLNTGEFDAIAGRTYQEQAWIAFNSHRSQAMGFSPEMGDFYYYYTLHTSLVPSSERETDLYDGLDATLTGLTEYPGDGSDFLNHYLAQIKAKAADALASYRPDAPTEAVTPLLEGLTLLRECQAALADRPGNDEARQALHQYLGRKIVAFETAAAQCLGLRLECLTDDAHITPGQPFHLSARLWGHHHPVGVDRVDFSPCLPEGWRVQKTSSSHLDKAYAQAEYQVTAAETAQLVCPYWLREATDRYHYRWPTGGSAGGPFGPPLVEMACQVTLGRYRLHLRRPALLREGFAGGFRELPMVVIPPISLHPESRRLMLQATDAVQRFTLKLVVRSNTENTGATGVLRVNHPAGWRVEPQQIDLSMGPVGDAHTAQFEVTIPAGVRPGQYPLRYIVNSGGRDYDVVLEPVRLGAPGLPYLPDGATCIKEAFITKPAEVTIQIIDIKFMPDLKYAYIVGAGNKVMPALSHFNLNFHPITDEELDFIDLSQFDAVVVGPNAYLVRDNLRKNGARLLTYVEQGGTLIVQYQAYGYQDGDFAPYPFRYHQPHDRVTYEDAPVTLLSPHHPLVNLPNKITADDFDDWVIERGLYFFGEWDQHYEPILACHDPGEEAKLGGMLVASYGRGTYVYAAYSFFRQLPAGVPGAFRLFANLLSLSAARILKRTTWLKDVSIFAFMDEAQLRAVAQIMTERWLATESWLGHEGDIEDEMYVITQGAVEIIRESSADQVIHVAQPGEVIGEMEVLGHIPRAAAMRAKGNVHLLVISGGDFRALMQTYPDMSARVIQMLVDKMLVTGRENREVFDRLD